MPSWITRTGRTFTVPAGFGDGVFMERRVSTAGYGIQQVFGGASPPTTVAARTCAFDHSVNGDAIVALSWTGTCPLLGSGQPDAAWSGSFNQYLTVGLVNSKFDSLPFTPTSYTVQTTKCMMRFTVDTTDSGFAGLVAADVGAVPAAYEVLAVTAHLTFTHQTPVSGSGWSCSVRTPTSGPDAQSHWIKYAELGSYPSLLSMAAGADGTADLTLVQDGTVSTAFRHELLAAVDLAEASGSDLGYTPVTRSEDWMVSAYTLTVDYRYLPVVGVAPPLWQRQRIGVLDAPEQWTAGLVGPQSSPWQGGTP